LELNKEQLVGLMMGFFQTKAITAALDLKVFDALADGPASAETVCRHAGIPETSGKRLLIALAALGLLTKNGGDYQLTDASRKYMLRSSPEWLGWLARHIDVFLYPLWSRTSEAVREDADQRKAVFDDQRTWFDILYQNPQDVVDFQEFLGIFAKPFIEGMIQEFRFSNYRRFLDIGSGIGTLPLAVAKHYPDLEIGLLELPQAAEFVRGRLRDSEHGRRIHVAEGDVIAGSIPKGEYDLVHLGWMLHDYAPDIQDRILRHIHDALPPGGTFMASETPLADDEAGPLFTALLSINMLVSTDGGIESTGEQYLERFRRAGFVNVRKQAIPGPRTLFIGEKAAD
jgi:4-hydroxy-2,2'-bipyrrole-5-carbaldehyde O-methyltransferase